MSAAPEVRRRAPPRVSGIARQPRCFESQQAWSEWLAARADAYSPCEDCSPDFKRRMSLACRCDRPETVFVEGDDGCMGVSADDPRFARLLMGLRVGGADPAEVSAQLPGLKLLTWLMPRAHPMVRRAIQVLLKRSRTSP